MKALSIRQPWATLIVFGCPIMDKVPVPDNPKAVSLEWKGKVIRKDVENRTWPLPKNFKVPQRIYIHASSKPDNGAIEPLIEMGLPPIIVLSLYDKRLTGAIIGEVTITGCVTNSKSPWAVPGQYHFLLSDPEFYKKPIPYTGRLGFFEVNTELEGRGGTKC